MFTLLLASALAGPPAPAPITLDDCRHTAERNLDLPIGQNQRLRLAAGAGSLRIEGRPGLRQIEVRGVACASHREFLEDLRLENGRESGGVWIETRHPDMDGWRFRQTYARLDLVVHVPEGLAMDVDDSSGWLEIRRVGSLDLQDSSGSLEIEGVRGSIRLNDSSGSIRIRDVNGDITLNDSSGGIDIEGVDGNVTVERDSSGGIEITRVTGSVRVESDSSGGITVRDIGGDFYVGRDGSGGISYRDVRGRVDIPRSR